jgi:hypothetical protein
MNATHSDLSDRILGETGGPVALHDQAAIRSAGTRMAQQASRELRLFSHDLDTPLYDQQEFLDAVRRIAVEVSTTAVHILLYDAKSAIHNGHRLIELARHLTSRIQIRRVPIELQERTEAYLLADDCGYVLRPLADVYEGTADFNAPLEVRRMREEFGRIWDVGDVHQELRRLYL